MTHDLATLTVDEARRLRGGRHRFRVERDSDPDEANGFVSFDCVGLESEHRSGRFRKGFPVNGEMEEGVVVARVMVIGHDESGPFDSFWEVRLVDAVEGVG